MYVPDYELGNCAVVLDSNTIRKYEQRPTNNSSVNYTDYYYNSHYIYKTGVQQFNNYSTLPDCRTDITNNWYQRTDITEIIVIASIFIFTSWFLVSKLVKTLLKGGRIK